MESINNRLKAIKKFDNKNKRLTPTKREPTAADLQQQGNISSYKTYERREDKTAASRSC
ncbi:hypothetical protein [Rickettsia helvetica]|uniref:hypothetical protein n=1 Tax=Rickettsia helvetica TaxID=35789 RepID=UPI001E5F9192|nr:hypothetical protein [Rickettsia helvetica]